eukprot:gene20234-24663_t
MSLKMDALQAAYNLITLYMPCKSVFVHFDLVSAMWKIMKVSSGGKASGPGGTADDGETSVADQSAVSKAAGSVADSDHGSGEDEDHLFLLVSHTLKELCEDAGADVNVLRKMMNDGVMNIVLKLAKIERVELKIDMSFCIFFLTRGQENMKILKRDSVDI